MALFWHNVAGACHTFREWPTFGGNFNASRLECPTRTEVFQFGPNPGQVTPRHVLNLVPFRVTFGTHLARCHPGGTFAQFGPNPGQVTPRHVLNLVNLRVYFTRGPCGNLACCGTRACVSRMCVQLGPNATHEGRYQVMLWHARMCNRACAATMWQLGMLCPECMCISREDHVATWHVVARAHVQPGMCVTPLGTFLRVGIWPCTCVMLWQLGMLCPECWCHLCHVVATWHVVARAHVCPECV